LLARFWLIPARLPMASTRECHVEVTVLEAEFSIQLRTIAASLEQKCDDLRREHPIQANMLSAVFKRMIECMRLFDSDEMSLEERTFRITAVSREIEELSSWLLDPALKLASDEIRRGIDSWTASYVGAGGKDVTWFVQHARNISTRRPKGHPVEVRLAAITGLEMKQAHPRLSWKKVADKVWPANRNVASAEQCLRQEVIALRKVLNKFGLPGSIPFERYPRKRVSDTSTE
jgi:hypothetical protein